MYSYRVRSQKLVGVGVTLLLVVTIIMPISGSISAKAPDNQSDVSSQATLASILSDDFNRCPSGSSIGDGWTVYKPSDTSVTLVNGFSDNAAVEMTVPEGSKHIISDGEFNAPRILQNLATTSTDDVTDFEIEIKFDSEFTSGTYAQVEGVVFVEQNTDPLTKDTIPYSRFTRFDFHTNGSQLRYTVAHYNMTASPTFHAVVGVITEDLSSVTGPMYMRIVRELKHYWTMYYSTNGNDWTKIELEANTLPSGEVLYYSTYFDLTVNQHGPFIGNTGDNPAFTGLIDYYMNTAYPIADEDGQKNKIYETIEGLGSITATPSLPSSGVYACGTSVSLRANPDSGWIFKTWGGDAANQGTTNPISVTMNGPVNVTATFAEEGTIGPTTVQAYIPFIMK